MHRRDRTAPALTEEACGSAEMPNASLRVLQNALFICSADVPMWFISHPQLCPEAVTTLPCTASTRCFLGKELFDLYLFI